MITCLALPSTALKIRKQARTVGPCDMVLYGEGPAFGLIAVSSRKVHRENAYQIAIQGAEKDGEIGAVDHHGVAWSRM
ncbi:MAG: hypothetical protein KatS3mg082_1912 [Nitrospiraceae bacterium]|nr:MAG: hypothetical protein KatS3mg004_2911 [Bryobacteraceae bacterium]GIW55508.1 MAG: hypothetical protein KatS3mg082_1912 [Nitrospiraceae bacterium]